MNDDFEKELQSTFLDEATQLLDDAERCFLSLETSQDSSELIDSIFRIAHNIKGSANAVGFLDLGSFTHLLESLLLNIKSGEIKVHRPVVDLLLRSNDCIVTMVNELKRNTKASFDNQALSLEIQNAIDNQQSTTVDESIQGQCENADASLCLETPSDGFHSFEEVEEVQPQPQPLPIVKNQKEIEKSPPAVVGVDESIRVSLKRVDGLINFIGELVILQTVLKEQSQSSPSALLRQTAHQLGKITKEIQELSMGLRMVPLKPTFQKMQRIVRDTSSALNKKVNFEVEGHETELDKTILERLGDPLVHLVRNAVDHGIEDSAERIALGKPELGTIQLRASHEGGSFVITVVDDGRGLDPEKLQAKAREKGLLKESSKLSNKESFQLIFSSGFSTKSTVSDVSGRGVGMDVVKTNIEQLQGSIQLESELGKGTRITIRLPLTLAIIDGMLVRSGPNRFIIPLSHIQESTSPAPEDLRKVTGLGEVYTLRGKDLLTFRLSRLLGEAETASGGGDPKIAIVVRNSENLVAVLVDDIIGQNQVVVKQLGPEHKDLKGFSGSTILGDGRAALILELPELIQRQNQASTRSPNKRSAA